MGGVSSPAYRPSQRECRPDLQVRTTTALALQTVLHTYCIALGAGGTPPGRQMPRPRPISVPPPWGRHLCLLLSSRPGPPPGQLAAGCWLLAVDLAQWEGFFYALLIGVAACFTFLSGWACA
ncbi:hypothetical protein BO71DRAFT_19883 [Aspergillus ellipticus CBS 707.79]|uniref:Uncharacterized protein n=1 Tax=Aspergillus ellipticus CBS 707.79 TaxID=1448320 RepID=A0A319D5K8_9EURO|nr:hypothetical protein BO71DRAFT_19883 [Aspergillus ellipticus CBS 707.79]